MRPEVSIIIRTHNEERWISHCLRCLAQQTLKDYEIILVDNESKDKTVERALSICPQLKLVTVSKFRPGHAINEGVRVASGTYITCLSAHCLPARSDWLERLRANFQDQNLAGVYGRQIPMRFSSAVDKRDLLITFGLDRRVQYRDPFFHNANSMFPRQVWENFRFAEDVTNIEDRIWAQQVLAAGYHIIYEPEAVVYHHHGIHQSNDIQRAQGVVRVMEERETANLTAIGYMDPIVAANLDTVAVLPVQRSSGGIDAKGVLFLVEHAVRSIQSSRLIKRFIVSTSDQHIADAATSLGCFVPRLRPKDLSRKDVRVDRVLQFELKELEDRGDYPDLVISLEITHPFRPPSLFDQLIETIVSSNADSVIAGRAEFRPCWTRSSQGYNRIDEHLRNRQDRDPLHIGLPALGCVSLPHVVRDGRRVGKETGVLELEDPFATIEVRTPAALTRARPFLEAESSGYITRGKSMRVPKRSG